MALKLLNPLYGDLDEQVILRRSANMVLLLLTHLPVIPGEFAFIDSLGSVKLVFESFPILAASEFDDEILQLPLQFWISRCLVFSKRSQICSLPWFWQNATRKEFPRPRDRTMYAFLLLPVAAAFGLHLGLFIH